jgi:radical SAM superfamily enzyme YgiQ (UPF0313 family)
MKILLTHGYFINEDEREQQIMKPYPPLGILSISAWLIENGFENEVFDTTFSNFTLLEEKLLFMQPDLIGIYTNLMTKLNVLRLVKFIKSESTLSHTKIVLGGPEVRNHAENFLNFGVDIIAFGEGESTMTDLARWVKGEIILENIDGIAYFNNKEIIQNKDRDKIKDPDLLPFPNRKAITLQNYLDVWRNKHGRNAINVSTMRGCPYTCKWCSRAVYGQSYRRRSASKVVDELQWIKANYDVDTIWFVDDVFSISHKWLSSFKDEIIAREAIIPYECITRADRMNEEVIQLLKASGCYRVWIGAESGSQKIIDAMDRRVDVNQVREMIIKSRAAGLEAGTFIMVGYPGETEEDLVETLHHLKTSNPDFYTITTAYPIKGTPLYEEVEANFTTELNWEESTDRMIDFKRTYPRKFYDYAIRWIYNEMAIMKAEKGNSFKEKLKIPYYKLKSLGSKSMMKTLKHY